MSNTPNLAVVAAPEEQEPACQTVSLLDALAQHDDDGVNAALAVLKLGAEAQLVSLFTEDAVPVTSHYLEATETWTGTYARCLGEGCPACKAGLNKSNHLFLPVVDRLDGLIKILKIPTQKGPGKLLTEIGQVLSMPNRSNLIIGITRNQNFVHHVTIEAEGAPDPEVLAAIKTFLDRVDQGVLRVIDTIPEFPAAELATHERIAKRLTIVGRG